MNRLFAESNRTALQYYLIMELAMLVWVFSGRHPVILILLLPFFRIMDRRRRRQMRKTYSPLPLLPFAVLSLFYEWAIPLALIMPIVLLFLTLRRNSKNESEMTEKGEDHESA